MRLHHVTVREFKCDDCGGEPDAPMLRNDIWLSVAASSDLLCIECVETRLKRRLMATDLKECLQARLIIKMAERLNDA